MIKKLSKPDLPTVLFLLSLMCAGLFHDYACAIASVILIAVIVWQYIKTKKLTVYVNLSSIASFVLVLFYGVGCLWALDSGMAFIGFVKFFPLILFLVLFMQENRSKQLVFEWFPYIMAGMTVISSCLSFIPPLKGFFTVNGRLSGFIQYPNTFALLLLISAIILISKERMTLVSYLMIAVYLFGIFYSGSRSVFVLTVISIPLCLLCTKKKKVRIALVGAFGILLLLGIISVLFLQNTDAFDRFLSISLNSSTFMGRFLYWRDALGVILKHPFGIGYMGYYYIQQSIQTGVYSVMYAHNELIQFMLDIGWIPALLLFGAVLKPVFSKKYNPYMRVALILFVLHSLFDFNLQYLSVLVLLLLFTEITDGKKYEIKNAFVGVGCTASFLIIIFGYFSALLIFFSLGKTEVVHSMYPQHTQNETVRLSDSTEFDEIADGIIKHNKYVPIAYSAKARSAFAQGDITSLIQYKTRVLEIAPFAYDEYEDYCYMLIHCISLYEDAGDKDSANFCENELIRVSDTLKSVPQRLSTLGKKILDTPKTVLPADVEKYILSIK